MTRKEGGISSSEVDTFQNRLKAIPTESILLSGKRFKEYQMTETTFVKSKMWPDKYEAELRGIELARANGICVPEIVEHHLDEWGSISYKLIDAPRLDQAVWNNYDSSILLNVGSVLATIHQIEITGDPNIIVFSRRNKYFLDDMRRRSMIPDSCYRLAEAAFSKACLRIYQGGRMGFVHGDYGLQNIFNTNPLTVFDWEYSHFGYPFFDIGSCLSDMVFAVTEGNWNFGDYFLGCQKVADGYMYGNQSIGNCEQILTTLRFLGHRVPPQFYLFAIEKLVVIDKNTEINDVLDGNTTPDESKTILQTQGLQMDELWGGKVLRALSRGGYQVNVDFWDWIRKDS